MAEDDRQESKIKVTDKRMFTADGELREDFRHLNEAADEAKAAEPAGAGPAPTPAPPDQPPPDRPSAAGPSEPKSPGGAEIPGGAGLSGQPGFLDLLAMLTEPIAVYMGDAKLPDGSTAENLDAARFYIGLLEVLSEKTAGNLTAQETAIVQDLLYQLRMRYVRKRG